MSAGRCFACDEAFKLDDLVLEDASGGLIHRACCGPDREAYTGADGGPLKDGEPIPAGWAYSDLFSPSEISATRRALEAVS